MPTEHIRLSYAFDELTDAAKDKAVETIADKLSGDWFDGFDSESVAETIVYEFALAIGTPNADEFGESDFPGVDGIRLDSWSVGHVQGDGVGFVGTLTRENAPKLPWVDPIDHVTLESNYNNYTSIWFAVTDYDDIDTSEMRSAIEAAIEKAHRAGYAQADYIGSEENAREHIEGNAHLRFNEDGTLFDW